MAKLKTAFDKHIYSTFFFLLLTLVLIISCRKIDVLKANQSPKVNPETRFFIEHASNDPFVKSVLGFVKRENEKKHFVANLVNKIGYPYWDKAIVASHNRNVRTASDSVNTVFIPFVLDDANTVNTTLIVRASPSDTNFLLLPDWKYSDQSYGSPEVDSTAESVALLFMLEDRSVFGYDRFTITNPSLFSSLSTTPGFNGREIKIKNNSNGRTALEYEVEVCFNSYVCPWPDYCNQHGGCDYMNCTAGYNQCHLVVSLCWTYIYDVDDGLWSTGGGGGPEGGQYGGSGAGWNSWDPPICEEEPQGRTTTYQDCGPGWTPPGITVPVEASQVYQDSLIAEKLKRLVIKMQNTPDSLYNAAQQDKHERTFTFEMINGDTIMNYIKSGGELSSSPTLTSNAFGFAHTHQQDVPITNADLNQCFDGPDIFKIYKNTCVDNYNLDLSFLITKDYYYAFVIVDKQKFKNYIDSICGHPKDIKKLAETLNNLHIDGWDNCSNCTWQKGSEAGTLAITANNNEAISGIRVFRSSKQNINFTLLTP